jgi:hypothetical protein
MFHAILAFLAGLLHAAPAEYCPYRPMLAHGDNAAHPMMIASTVPSVPCSLAARSRLAELAASRSKDGQIV